MRPQPPTAPNGLAAMVLLVVGCFGTEGGNPHGVRDLGPVTDMATSSDGFAPSQDGGGPCPVDGGPAEPRCGDEAEGPPECPCSVGEPVVFAENAAGFGQRTTLLGPTEAGGFVAVHGRVCAENCLHLAALEVHRFDAEGTPIGEPIEVTRSSAWVDQGALLMDDSLVLVFADERSGPSDLYFARMDLGTGEWIVAPRLAVSAALPILRVWLAPTSGGFGVLYSFTIDETLETETPGAHLVRLNDGGSVVTGPVRVVDHPSEAAGFAVNGDGFLLGRWTTDNLELVPLSIDGAPTGPATTWSSHVRGSRELLVVPNGSGHRIVWSDGLGLHIAMADAAGRQTGASATLGLGIAGDVVAWADGTAAVLWSPLSPCHSSSAAEQSLLSRVDATGARSQPDLVVPPSGELVDTARGLVASHVTVRPASRAYWVDVCLP